MISIGKRWRFWRRWLIGKLCATDIQVVANVTLTLAEEAHFTKCTLLKNANLVGQVSVLHFDNGGTVRVGGMEVPIKNITIQREVPNA